MVNVVWKPKKMKISRYMAILYLWRFHSVGDTGKKIVESTFQARWTVAWPEQMFIAKLLSINFIVQFLQFFMKIS